jgi:cytosolic 5'-nucleotidase 3
LAQVVMDFDRTLTAFRHRGRPADSCHGAIEKSRFASPAWRAQTDALFQRFYPMEIDTSLDRPRKLAAMVEWWESAHALMVANRVERVQLPVMVAESNMALRNGARELLADLAHADVPTLIFSAGIADVITEFLRQQGCLTPNVHVVSNRLRFDADGVLVGFDGPLIHTLNKNAGTLATSPEPWAHDPARDHVLLLGDNLGDVHMADGLVYAARLSIGFLNDRVQQNLSAYRATFDAVVVDDGSMALAHQLFRHVLTGTGSSEILGATVVPAAASPCDGPPTAAPSAP